MGQLTDALEQVQLRVARTFLGVGRWHATKCGPYMK